MKLKFVYTTIIILVVSCQNETKPKILESIDLSTNDSLRQYFVKNLAYPKNDHDVIAFEDFNQYCFSDKVLDSFKNAWYTYHLYALKEYPIQKEINTTKYRFLWLRSFHKPVCIIFSKTNGEIILELKTSDGYGGYHSGTLNKDFKVYLNDSIWNDFEKRLRISKFWYNAGQIGEQGGDGSQLLLEAKTPKNYNLVTTWSLDYRDDLKKRKFRDLCKYIITLAEQSTSIPELKEKY
jgi:hypothetical protein